MFTERENLFDSEFDGVGCAGAGRGLRSIASKENSLEMFKRKLLYVYFSIESSQNVDPAGRFGKQLLMMKEDMRYIILY